jgi:hypothetical protein
MATFAAVVAYSRVGRLTLFSTCSSLLVLRQSVFFVFEGQRFHVERFHVVHSSLFVNDKIGVRNCALHGSSFVSQTCP